MKFGTNVKQVMIKKRVPSKFLKVTIGGKIANIWNVLHLLLTLTLTLTLSLVNHTVKKITVRIYNILLATLLHSKLL